MASLLRQIVAGPRARHPEADLDLCYVTDNIIATSGPSGSYPQLAYRNPLSGLVKFLDSKHGEKWSIWEFRAEGTGYPDSEVYNRILHYPFPDHHPPPFALIPHIIASMRNWLTEDKERIVVVHCKAGKGRSGTMACSYLISECGWTASEAKTRFTERRMRPGFGAGVSIPSQLRWIDYVTHWTKIGKVYVEQQIEIVEIHIWGLRDGVKVAVEGYVEGGKVIKNFHTFHKREKTIVSGTRLSNGKLAEVAGFSNDDKVAQDIVAADAENKSPVGTGKGSGSRGEQIESVRSKDSTTSNSSTDDKGGEAVIFKPEKPIILPSNDVMIDLERRNKAAYGWSMVTSVSHVWFNTYFEGLPTPPSSASTSTQAPTTSADATSTTTPPPPESASSGVFEIDWDKMDGIKGSSRKGIRSIDRLAVVWKVHSGPGAPKPEIIKQPAPGEHVQQMKPAVPTINTDAAAADEPAVNQKDLGLRTESPLTSANVSKANSLHSMPPEGTGSNQSPVRGTTPPASSSGQESGVVGAATAAAAKHAEVIGPGHPGSGEKEGTT